MASVPTVDIDAILKPISGDKPCGLDPRDGVSFELLKEARREEDAASQGEWKREVQSLVAKHEGVHFAGWGFSGIGLADQVESAYLYAKSQSA